MAQGDFAEFAGFLGILAGLVSFVVLGYVEVYTVPGLIEQIVFRGDPSAGFPLGFLVIGAAFILIPANIWGAAVIGLWVYKKLKEPVP
jgi:hypothetical protein